MQTAPILKEQRLLMGEFPRANLGVKLNSLNSFLSARLKYNKDEEFQIRKIKMLMKEIEEINSKVSEEVNIIYSTYRKGDLHIQEIYNDLYSKTMDTKRMNERIAGLQEIKKEVDQFLSEELEKDKLIENYSKELYLKAENLQIFFHRSVNGGVNHL